jgi:hypothetical protein
VSALVGTTSATLSGSTVASVGRVVLLKKKRPPPHASTERGAAMATKAARKKRWRAEVAAIDGVGNRRWCAG